MTEFQIGSSQPANVNTSRKLVQIDGGVTKLNNKFGIFKDKDGNSVYRVDYANDNKPTEVYDAEEVRTPDGILKSFTERSHTDDGTSYYVRHYFDENGTEIKTFESKYDVSGKFLETKELTEDKDKLSGMAIVHIGTPEDGEWGDPELQDKFINAGARIAGRQE